MRTSDRQPGQALVEFVLVVPVILLGLFGLLQLTLLMAQSLKVQYAAYIEARSACVHSSGTAGAGPVLPPVTVETDWSGGRVRVDAKADIPLIFPFIDRVLGVRLAGGGRAITLRAWSDMRDEGE